MALDERRISARTKLTESYLQAERQKAVMFATLNRVRQSLQDQGAQPQPGQALKVSANVPDVPFLWMPHGSAGTTQQGLHGAKCLRTGSGSVGLQSVNKVHGLASPLDTLNPTVTQAEATTCTHSSSAHGITPSMPVSEHQRSEAARFTSLASQATHPSHEHNPIPHPSVPSLVSEPSEQQQAAAGRPHLHPVAQVPHSHAYTHRQQAEGRHSQQQAEDQHSRQRAAAANLPKPVESGMPPPGQAEKYLSGVRRAAGGGWEARVGRHGSSKARESLGIHATAFAAARAYDRALLTTPRPSEQHGNFNFPVQDYVAAESSDLSKAAMAQLRVFHDAKPSSKRLRPSPSKATHQCAPPKCNRTSVSPAQVRHARNPPFGHGDASPPLPVKQSRNQQTVADPSLHHRPVANAEEPGNDADWHQTPVMPSSMSQSTPQLHKVDTGLRQADIANKGSAGAVNMTRGLGLGSGLRDPDDEPSTSGNHRNWGSVMSGASLATSGQPSAQTLLPKAEPVTNLDACHASALEMHSAPTGTAADTAAPDDAARHHTEPERAPRSSEAHLDTGQCPEHPSLHPVVCHAHKRARAATPPAAPARPGAPAASIQPQADGPAATLHADASLPDKPAEHIPGADPLPDGHNSTSASHARPAAAAEPPSSLLPSPKPETVRAEDSDDDVEIMDDSPVHMPASSASLSMRGSPSNTDDCNEQQARDRAPYWGLAEGNQEPQLPEQLSDQQLHGKQQDVPTWQQQQQQYGARYQGPQQEQQQPQPGKTSQEPQQHPPQQQQRFQQFLRQQQEHLSWQHKAQQQPQQQPQAGQSCMSADLSGLSHLAQQAATAAGGAWPQPSNAAPATAVKQEPAVSQSHDSAHMRGGGCPHGEAVAGSSLTHPLELSESDADSSASSSVDPSQRVPAPWLHADTAASRQPEARGYASVQCVMPASSVSAQAAAQALLRQASQGSTLTNGHLRTKRGPTDKAEGPRSKLARVTTAAVPAAHKSRRAGATAAEAVDLSDDDDDVVIIEENMQPEPQGPRGLKAPAAAKQPGAPPASRSGWHVKPRVPSAAAAARAALFGPSPSPKPSPSSSLTTPSSGTHTQHISSPPPPAIHAGEADLQASSVLSATLAALRQAATGNAQAVATSADAEESAAAAAAGVAELRRTEQQSNPEFRAAQETEWQQRQAEIGKQSEYAQRLKRQRKAEKEKKARQEAEVAKRLAEHRAEEGRKEAEEQEKDQLRIKIRERLTRKLDKAKTLRQVLTAFGIPVDGGFTATSAQVDKAYKKAMILFHPDKHVNKGLEKQLEAEESFKIISHAKNRKTK